MFAALGCGSPVCARSCNGCAPKGVGLWSPTWRCPLWGGLVPVRPQGRRCASVSGSPGKLGA
eukprot:13923909-Alexandrium_andersonii.AAC.1